MAGLLSCPWPVKPDAPQTIWSEGTRERLFRIDHAAPHRGGRLPRTILDPLQLLFEEIYASTGSGFYEQVLNAPASWRPCRPIRLLPSRRAPNQEVILHLFTGG